MSRLQDYELRGLPQQAIDLLDDIRELVNNSKYQSSVATTGVPGWTANTGEFAFFSSGSAGGSISGQRPRGSWWQGTTRPSIPLRMGRSMRERGMSLRLLTISTPRMP